MKSKIFSLVILTVCLFLPKSSVMAVFEPRGPSQEESPVVILDEMTIPSVASSKEPVTETERTVSANESQATTTSDKLILVDLTTQTLTYSEGTTTIGAFLISSGLHGTQSPQGEFTVLKKYDRITYTGANYNFPNTKWNLLFKKNKPLNYYIHGAYWHHNFGHPMSHGCINVSYENMEPLYNWADEGTKIVIQ